MRRLLPVLLLVLAPVVAGCGDDSTPPTPARPQALATATALSTPLPTGWPAGLQLPEGSTVVDTNDADGLLEVDFESQELAEAVTRFLDRELTAAGYQAGTSATRDADVVTTSYTSATQDVTLIVDDRGGTLEGTIRITQRGAS